MAKSSIGFILMSDPLINNLPSSDRERTRNAMSSRVQKDADMLLDLQKRRQQTYLVFERASYDLLCSEMKTEDQETYKETCAEVTKKFTETSRAVKAIGARRAEENENDDLSKVVKDIQDLEQKKLHAVTKLHVLRFHERRGSLGKNDAPALRMLVKTIRDLDRDLLLKREDIEALSTRVSP